MFTSPDETDNRLWQAQLSGSYFVNDNFTITGQVYRRNSKRKSVNSDVYTEYGNSGGTRNLDAGDQYTCLYDSNNQYGLPDYYLVKEPSNMPEIVDAVFAVLGNGEDPAAHPLYQEYVSNPEVTCLINGMVGFGADPSLLSPSSFNHELPGYFVDYAKYQFDLYKNYRQENVYVPQAGGPPLAPPLPPIINGTQAYNAFGMGMVTGALTDPIDFDSGYTTYFMQDEGNGNYSTYKLIFKTPQNAAACGAARAKYRGNDQGGIQAFDPITGAPLYYDGAINGSGGMVEGVPTAVITNTEIDQIVHGASVQLNWNLEHHKFMVGASIDSAGAAYGSGQRMGFFDAKRHAYLDPARALDAFTPADVEVRSNDFDGTSITKSLYLSETWSPVDTLHLTGAMRYNATSVKNKLAAREHGGVVINLHQFVSQPDEYNICRPGDPCETGYKIPDFSRVLNPSETEKFSYYSLNPSLGASWQVTKEVNVFGNLSRGTRTPSVIELGCALDKTMVYDSNQDGSPDLSRPAGYKSVVENRSCSMPTTLSGDPYLPQIKATSYDIGVRGSWGQDISWNLGVYRTDLKDDIYMITLPGNRSFFDTIGDTRRQGIEAGISGRVGKATFHLNYSLTDATFQDTFTMASDHNSSSVENVFRGRIEAGERPPRSITVKPGNRMPGVPLHNLNASVQYQVSDKWSVGLSAVVHSESYLRGNENNEHRPGVPKYITFDDPVTLTQRTEARPASNNPGKVPGYATLNFNTKYQFTSEWSASLMVMNLLGKEYFTAGRLGVNPFSPSIYGTRGPDGYNHNSLDWLDSTFVAPGAPRAAWFTLRYEFDPRK